MRAREEKPLPLIVNSRIDGGEQDMDNPDRLMEDFDKDERLPIKRNDLDASQSIGQQNSRPIHGKVLPTERPTKSEPGPEDEDSTDLLKPAVSR